MPVSLLSSVTSDGAPPTPTTPSAANGPSVPPSSTGVVLRETSKPPVARPRSQTENTLQRIEPAPTPQPSTPPCPPVPRPRQGSVKGSSLAAIPSSVPDTPPALPPKPSQSPPVSLSLLHLRVVSAFRIVWSLSTSLLLV